MRKYCQLTEEDRIEIYAVTQGGISQAKIADKLARNAAEQASFWTREVMETEQDKKRTRKSEKNAQIH